MRKSIPENIKRKLYAESMGRCMNPVCETELFLVGDIAEKAHIIPYSVTADDSFGNLILLCPNCHTDFDKNFAFQQDKVKSWKYNRQERVLQIFSKQFDTFEKLEVLVKPILENNRRIYENYYLKDNPMLWKKFEGKVLVNNQQLKLLLNKNKDLFQKHPEQESSNLEIVNQLIIHIDEFKEARGDFEKIRTVLFPKKILSIFGLEQITEYPMQSTESLECLISNLESDSPPHIEISLDNNDPFIKYYKNNEEIILYLKDTTRVRQLYESYNCFRKTDLRLNSLIFILQWLKNNGVKYHFSKFPCLSYIKIKSREFRFVYKYCLSRAELISLAPRRGLNIVNLHHWNGMGCISNEAYSLSKDLEVALLNSNDFYKHVHKIQDE